MLQSEINYKLMEMAVKIIKNRYKPNKNSKVLRLTPKNIKFVYDELQQIVIS